MGLVGFTQSLTNTLMGLDGKKNSFRYTSGNVLFELKIVWHIPNHRFCIFGNKSAHRLESTKHSICLSSIAVYVVLVCSTVCYRILSYVLGLYETFVTDVWQTDSLTDFGR